MLEYPIINQNLMKINIVTIRIFYFPYLRHVTIPLARRFKNFKICSWQEERVLYQKNLLVDNRVARVRILSNPQITFN